MPVTVVLRHHEPRVHARHKSVNSLDGFLEQCCPGEYHGTEKAIYESSFAPGDIDNKGIYPSSSSLVRSAVEAWGRHSHLVLRPDDLWAQILVQLNLYMRKNGEALRDLFVSHSGKKDLVIASEDNWRDILACFQVELQKTIKTPWLSEWIQGDFSTSTQTDELSNIVLMMGLMSTYFEYFADETCGIPSITLLGTKQDWQRLLEKMERLKSFGDEPKAYGERLRPILTRIVSTFDHPMGVETRDFWDQMVHAKVKHDALCGKPPLQYTVSGWILGLFYWGKKGSINKQFAQGLRHVRTLTPSSLIYDDIQYGEAFLEELPLGYAKVRCSPLNAQDKSKAEIKDRWLLAGNIGKSIVDGAPEGYTATAAKDDQSRASSLSTISNEKAGSQEKTTSVSRVLCGLSCFGASSSEKRRKTLLPKASCEKMARPALTKASEVKLGHSTIQPLSGWFLFSANEPIDCDLEMEEDWGPTVDAIDSCSNVEHYRVNR